MISAKRPPFCLTLCNFQWNPRQADVLKISKRSESDNRVDSSRRGDAESQKRVAAIFLFRFFFNRFGSTVQCCRVPKLDNGKAPSPLHMSTKSVFVGNGKKKSIDFLFFTVTTSRLGRDLQVTGRFPAGTKKSLSGKTSSRQFCADFRPKWRPSGLCDAGKIGYTF